MIRALWIAALVTLLRWALACAPLPGPADLPPDGPGDCSSACARLVELGGCGLPLDGCAARCADALAAEGDVGVRFPTGCLTAAASCEEARSCR